MEAMVTHTLKLILPRHARIKDIKLEKLVYLYS
jgi:hypothetical protein